MLPRIHGRVLSLPSPQEVLLLSGGITRRFHLPTVSNPSLTPGVLIEATLSEENPSQIVSHTVVQVPLRDPFGTSTETTRLQTHGVVKALRERAAALQRIRSWFAQNDFLEVDTPHCVYSPGLDLHLHAFSVQNPDGSHAGYLSTSPEYQLKRLLAGGIDRCFQFAHAFRAEELGRKHEPEFTLLEWYRCWASFEELLRDTEALVRHACDAEFLRVNNHVVSLALPFARLTVREAFARFAPSVGDPVQLCEKDEDTYFRVLVEEIEPHLGFDRPCFLTHYPASQASLARLSPDDNSVAERTELYLAGIELCNGFAELTDPQEQRTRLLQDQEARKKHGLPVYPIDEGFLAALEEGMPPAVGNALGIDRLIALMLGKNAIEQVLAMPYRRVFE